LLDVCNADQTSIIEDVFGLHIACSIGVR
jgi:hypothetical protein